MGLPRGLAPPLTQELFLTERYVPFHVAHCVFFPCRVDFTVSIFWGPFCFVKEIPLFTPFRSRPTPKPTPPDETERDPLDFQYSAARIQWLFFACVVLFLKMIAFTNPSLASDGRLKGDVLALFVPPPLKKSVLSKAFVFFLQR